MKNKKIGKEGETLDYTTKEDEMKETTLEELEKDPKFPIQTIGGAKTTGNGGKENAGFSSNQEKAFLKLLKAKAL